MPRCSNSSAKRTSNCERISTPFTTPGSETIRRLPRRGEGPPRRRGVILSPSVDRWPGVSLLRAAAAACSAALALALAAQSEWIGRVVRIVHGARRHPLRGRRRFGGHRLDRRLCRRLSGRLLGSLLRLPDSARRLHPAL